MRSSIVSLPYYKFRYYWNEREVDLLGEARIIAEVSPELRMVLVLPAGVRGFLPTPLPGSVKISPISRDLFADVVIESIKLILESGAHEEPPFRFKGFRALLKTIYSGGLYKGYYATKGLNMRMARGYVRDILGITGVGKIRFLTTMWKPLRISYMEDSLEIVKIEGYDNGNWKPESTLMKLARAESEAFNNLLSIILKGSGGGPTNF
ncbi:MAG: hypothetical protein F7C35_03060 [Desulfurococcales archaeon]|nr:hypothetical protein [Desulfurococcales archaeon]